MQLKALIEHYKHRQAEENSRKETLDKRTAENRCLFLKELIDELNDAGLAYKQVNSVIVCNGVELDISENYCTVYEDGRHLGYYNFDGGQRMSMDDILHLIAKRSLEVA